MESTELRKMKELFSAMPEKDQVSFVNTIVHDVWFHDHEIPPESDHVSGLSKHVLIDLDGWRNDFRVGWYNHELKKWMTHDNTEIHSSMLWTYIK